MALLYAESFDDGNTGYLSTPAPNAAYGYHGKGIRVGDNTATGIYLAAVNPVVMGFWFRIITTGTGVIVGLSSASWAYCHLRYDQTDERVYIDPKNAAKIYSPIGSVPLNTWHHVEFKVYISTSSVGYTYLYLDGVLVGSATGQDWYIGPPASYAIGGHGDSNFVDAMDLDDVYMASTTDGGIVDVIGPSEVRTFFPTGNGNSSALVGSDADSTDNYLLVDELEPSTADYVGSATAGAKDTYTHAALAAGEVPMGVIIKSYAAKTDVNAKTFRALLRSGTTDYPGATRGLSEGYTWTQDVWDVDPDTAAAWGKAGFDATEFGQEVVA